MCAISMAMLIPITGCSTMQKQEARERISLNADWRFQKDDPPDSKVDLSYRDIKQWIMATGNEFLKAAAATTQPSRPEGNLGEDVAYTKADFNDSNWRQLNLPHDWGIEGLFKQEYPGETGKLPWWGKAWYRKHFKVGAEDQGKQIYLDVDGAMAYATVWLNGQFVGGWPYGYASWRVDLTPYIKVGGENVLAIRLDNPQNSSRWYPGGGIYRNVWLVKTAPLHVGHWGTYITTPEVKDDSATVDIKTTIDNRGKADADAKLTVAIYDTDAKGEKSATPVASLTTDKLAVAAGGSQTADSQIKIANPKLWGVDSPHLYHAVCTVESGGQVTDVYETPFGVRTIQFTTDNGFLLNGKRVPINGVCDHHDLGAFGSALNTRALQRQLEILREMGCNAIRTSHNPPAPELLDLADQMGFLVMDESFDCWAAGKTRNDYHLLFPDWHEKDWRAELRRDRNHPSIIIWSIGNEIHEQGSPAGHQIAAALQEITHEEDPTRPVSAACNDQRAGYNGFQKYVDVFGYNYKPTEYGHFRSANPGIPLYGSETASCISTRGEYFFPVSNDKSKGEGDFQMSSYDLYAPRWATPPDAEFKGQEEFPFVAGEFVWTGFDYIGEPTPYGGDATILLNFTDPAEKEAMAAELKERGKIQVPSRSSYFGIIDLAGFKKDRFYLYQSVWRPDFPMAHILPHWNWPDRVGQVTPVHVYTSGDEAELFLNGKSLGRKKKGQYEYRLRWDDVKYEPGELHVVAYKNGKQWAEDTMKTTGAAAKMTLQPDRATIHADGADLSFVTVSIADKDGQMVPRSKNLVKFEVTGPGEIAAVDNGDPTSFEPFQASERKAFNGLCLVIIRSKPGEAGKISLKANSDGLESATTVIATEAAK